MDIPDRISHYRILREINRGGMGAVYEAVDEDLDRKVALKVTRASDRYEGQELVEVRNRLRLEAQLLSKLDHPNLVRVYAFQQLEDLELFSMELIEGETLKERIDREGSWPPTQAVALISRVADVVAAIHGAGVIHLDLKPENIILTQEGEPRIIDFGIAHVRGAMEVAPGAGRLAGTPNYMAPEQILGQEAVPATDVFALGAILYELLSGERAFGEASPTSAIQEVLNDTPPLLADREAGRSEFGQLHGLLRDCLAKDPTDRPRDAAAFLDRLYRDLVAPPPPRPESTPPSEESSPAVDPLSGGDRTPIPTGPSGESQSRRTALILVATLAFIGFSIWGSLGWPTPRFGSRPQGGGGAGVGLQGLPTTANDDRPIVPEGTEGTEQDDGGPESAPDEEVPPIVQQENPTSQTEPEIPGIPADWAVEPPTVPPPAGAVGLFTDPPGAIVRRIRGQGDLSGIETPLWVTVPVGGELWLELRVPGFQVDTQRMVRGVPKLIKLRQTGQ